MRRIKKLILFVCLFVLVTQVKAAGFEGSVTFINESVYDTSYMICYVKGGMIRLEERDTDNKLKNTYLVDTLTESVILLNNDKKLYTFLKKNNLQEIEDCDQYSVSKTQNSKVINGEKCYQWRIKCSQSNSEMCYWVTQNDFNFFRKLAKTFSQTENNWKYFSHIPGNSGFFPMLSVERNMVRDEKQRTQVLKIQRKVLDKLAFTIPSDYKLFVMQ